MQAKLVAVASAVALTIAAGHAAAQSMKALAGTYAGVSFEQTDAAGTKMEIFGANPRAMLVLTADGRYTIVVARSTLPKFASNSRMKGTAEENAAIVTGSLAHFGKYSVDEKEKAIIFHVETATYPNWDGVPQKRPFTLKNGVLNYRVATVSGGTGSASVTWKRIK
jgi:lipocalin-like protein